MNGATGAASYGVRKVCIYLDHLAYGRCTCQIFHCFFFFFSQTPDSSGYQDHVRDEESGIISNPADLLEDGNEEVIAMEHSSTAMFNSRSEPFLILLHALFPDSQDATQPDRRQSLEVSALPLPLMGQHGGRFCSQRQSWA